MDNTCLGGQDVWDPWTGNESGETVLYFNEGDAAVTVYVIIDSYNVGAAGSFELVTKTGTIQQCIDDHDIGTVANLPYTVNSNLTGKGNDVHFLSNCAGTDASPEEVYEIDLTAGETIKVTATSTADLVLTISNNCSVCLAGFDYGNAGDGETIYYVAPADGTYFITVEGYGAADVGAYSLEVKVPATCDDGISYVGCCDGNVATWCEDGELKTYDCEANYGVTCGWYQDSLQYWCKETADEDPSGNNPLACYPG